MTILSAKIIFNGAKQSLAPNFFTEITAFLMKLAEYLQKLIKTTLSEAAFAGLLNCLLPMDKKTFGNALDPKAIATYPPADIALERIGDLVKCDLAVLLGKK